MESEESPAGLAGGREFRTRTISGHSGVRHPTKLNPLGRQTDGSVFSAVSPRGNVSASGKWASVGITGAGAYWGERFGPGDPSRTLACKCGPLGVKPTLLHRTYGKVERPWDGSPETVLQGLHEELTRQGITGGADQKHSLRLDMPELAGNSPPGPESEVPQNPGPASMQSPARPADEGNAALHGRSSPPPPLTSRTSAGDAGPEMAKWTNTHPL